MRCMLTLFLYVTSSFECCEDSGNPCPLAFPMQKWKDLKKRRTASSILPGILCRRIGIGLQDEIKVEFQPQKMYFV